MRFSAKIRWGQEVGAMRQPWEHGSTGPTPKTGPTPIILGNNNPGVYNPATGVAVFQAMQAVVI
jgi:hypothetical protein